MTGVELIAAERKRQITEEGWTSSHDDKHRQGELAKAGASYASVASSQIKLDVPYAPVDSSHDWRWPWERKWWKPSTDPIRNLVKAGALIAAEIDRLQRKDLTKETEG